MTSLSDLVAPRDPRETWSLPPLGELPVLTRLDEIVSRVVAPNASAMTLDGTNTYVLSLSGSGTAVVIDPGPTESQHRARVEAALAEVEAEVGMVLVTHHHADHAAAAISWAAEWGCQVAAATSAVAGPDGRVIGAGQVLRLGGINVEVVATPGHCADHLAFRLGHGPLLSGDHILGRGTSVVTWPEGDLIAYLSSLRRVLALGPDALYPGHGPELSEDPLAVVRYYLDHRSFREAQLMAALGEGPSSVEDVVAQVYAAVDRRLWPAATQSTRAGLEKLRMDGRGEELDDGRWALVA
jgi:glyoxylase-like metal-dependent hydrolase (beta-lactamase superfamily II)